MSIPIFDPVQISEAFIKIIDYNFKDEVKHFEETYSKEGFHGFGKIETLDEINEAIHTIERIEEGTEHILYSLLIIKSAFYDLKNIDE